MRYPLFIISAEIINFLLRCGTRIPPRETAAGIRAADGQPDGDGQVGKQAGGSVGGFGLRALR